MERDKEIIRMNFEKIMKGTGDIKELIYDTLKRKYLIKEKIDHKEMQILKSLKRDVFSEGLKEFYSFLKTKNKENKK